MSTHPQNGTLREDVSRPDRAIVDALSRFPVSHVADALGGFSILDPGIRRMTGTGSVCGPAVTVTTRPADLLFVLKAGDFIQPGDVLVVDGGGREDGALLGEFFAETLKADGCVGVVLDGAMRDVAQVDALGLPVYARNTYPGTRTMTGPGAINVTIQCGGVLVSPGDIVCADADGIVVVPGAHAAEVLAAAGEVASKEQSWREGLDAGRRFSAIHDLDAQIEPWRTPVASRTT